MSGVVYEGGAPSVPCGGPKTFVEELFALMRRHKASMHYTIEDDGVHIQVDGEDVFVGFLDSGAPDA